MQSYHLEAIEPMIGRSDEIARDTVLLEKNADAHCEARFSALVADYSRLVYRAAYAVLRNSHDAEDIAQEVFLKLYRRRQWDEIQDARAYLSRLAWRAAIDKLKARSPQPPREDLPFEAPALGETPEQTALAANWSAVVHQLIDALPDELRLPLALSAEQDLKSADIARLLGIPEGTVRTRVMKARAVLRQKLSVLSGNRHGRQSR